jgi:hypothetical protein
VASVANEIWIDIDAGIAFGDGPVMLFAKAMEGDASLGFNLIACFIAATSVGGPSSRRLPNLR